MDQKKEKKSETKVVNLKKRVPIRWQLTLEDKKFLRSCNVDPK